MVINMAQTIQCEELRWLSMTSRMAPGVLSSELVELGRGWAMGSHMYGMCRVPSHPMNWARLAIEDPT